jgi:hypothetical protein
MYPPFNSDVIDERKRVASGWISWFLSVTGGGKVTNPALSASPATYQNTTNGRQQAFISAGTVTSVALSRDNSTFYTLPASIAVLLPGDYLKITYPGAAPTLTVFPI